MALEDVLAWAINDSNDKSLEGIAKSLASGALSELQAEKAQKQLEDARAEARQKMIFEVSIIGAALAALLLITRGRG